MNSTEFQALVAKVARNDPKTTDIALKFWDDFDIHALTDALLANTRVENLSIWKKIEPVDVQALANVLLVNTGLKSLGINNTGTEPLAIQALVEALLVNTRLMGVGIMNMLIGDVGAQALANVVRHGNSGLKTLFIHGNRIGDAGATALAGAISERTSPLLLNLEDNWIGDQGAKALAKCFIHRKSNATLRVKLDVNRFTNAGRRSLASARSMVPTGLRLEFTFTTDETMPAWERASNMRAALATLEAAWAHLRPEKDIVVLRPGEEAGLGHLPKDIYLVLRKALLDTIDDETWEFEHVPEPPQQKRQTNACIGCNVAEGRWIEEHRDGKVFCGSYCQLRHHLGFPDIRTSSPGQLADWIRTQC
jgi:Leucine Rich repeat